MEIRQIKYFLEIAQVRNYSMAAERLFVSQPALSSSIKQLEREIGSPLFLYKKKNLSLTPAGMDLLGKAKPFMKSYYELTDSFHQNSQDQMVGRIRLGISSLLANSIYVKYVIRFTSRYPAIHLALREDASSDLHHLLSNNKIDIGLVIRPVETPLLEVLMLTPINSKKCFLCRKDHPLSVSSSLSLQALQNEKLIVLTEKFGFTGECLKEWQAYGIPANISLKSSSKSFITSAIAGSDLNAVLPEMFLTNSDYVNFHVGHLDSCEEEVVPVGLVYKRGYDYNPGSVFMKHLKESIVTGGNPHD